MPVVFESKRLCKIEANKKVTTEESFSTLWQFSDFQLTTSFPAFNDCTCTHASSIPSLCSDLEEQKRYVSVTKI